MRGRMPRASLHSVRRSCVHLLFGLALNFHGVAKHVLLSRFRLTKHPRFLRFTCFQEEEVPTLPFQVTILPVARVRLLEPFFHLGFFGNDGASDSHYVMVGRFTSLPLSAGGHFPSGTAPIPASWFLPPAGRLSCFPSRIMAASPSAAWSGGQPAGVALFASTRRTGSTDFFIGLTTRAGAATNSS